MFAVLWAGSPQSFALGKPIFSTWQPWLLRMCLVAIIASMLGVVVPQKWLPHYSHVQHASLTNPPPFRSPSYAASSWRASLLRQPWRNLHTGKETKRQTATIHPERRRTRRRRLTNHRRRDVTWLACSAYQALFTMLLYSHSFINTNTARFYTAYHVNKYMALCVHGGMVFSEPLLL